MKNKILLLFLVCVLLLAACAGTPPFDDLTFTDGYTHISAPDGRTWKVIFEFPVDTTFTGEVRHISRWYDSSNPFMSHDILVTSGDFASPEIVKTWVFQHKFFYRYQNQYPSGKINLLHVFPASLEVFKQLQQIRKWDRVSISGHEILKIQLYDAQGKDIGYFKDMGCNTILVTAVNIPDEETPTP